MSETEEVILSEISSALVRKWEERQGDLTQAPTDAEHFFDELEEKAESIAPEFAYLINYYAVRLYGTLPIQNNPFLEI